MEPDEKILQELSEIKRMLALLTYEKKGAVKEQIENEFLTSEERKIMYSMFDGKNSLKGIAKEAGTSSEAVRLFALSLEKAGLLEYVEINAKTRYPKLLF